MRNKPVKSTDQVISKDQLIKFLKENLTALDAAFLESKISAEKAYEFAEKLLAFWKQLMVYVEDLGQDPKQFGDIKQFQEQYKIISKDEYKDIASTLNIPLDTRNRILTDAFTTISGLMLAGESGIAAETMQLFRSALQNFINLYQVTKSNINDIEINKTAGKILRLLIVKNYLASERTFPSLFWLKDELRKKLRFYEIIRTLDLAKKVLDEKYPNEIDIFLELQIAKIKIFHFYEISQMLEKYQQKTYEKTDTEKYKKNMQEIFSLQEKILALYAIKDIGIFTAKIKTVEDDLAKYLDTLYKLADTQSTKSNSVINNVGNEQLRELAKLYHYKSINALGILAVTNTNPAIALQWFELAYLCSTDEQNKAVILNNIEKAFHDAKNKKITVAVDNSDSLPLELRSRLEKNAIDLMDSEILINLTLVSLKKYHLQATSPQKQKSLTSFFHHKDDTHNNENTTSQNGNKNLKNAFIWFNYLLKYGHNISQQKTLVDQLVTNKDPAITKIISDLLKEDMKELTSIKKLITADLEAMENRKFPIYQRGPLVNLQSSQVHIYLRQSVEKEFGEFKIEIEIEEKTENKSEDQSVEKSQLTTDFLPPLATARRGRSNTLYAKDQNNTPNISSTENVQPKKINLKGAMTMSEINGDEAKTESPTPMN